MPEPTSVGPYDPKEWVSNIFSTNPSGEGLSYEQLKQRRAIAAALASRARPYPTTIGQGLAALGEGIGDRLYQERTEGYERQQRDLDRRAREDAGGISPPPPAAPRAGRTSALDVPEPVATADLASTILARQEAPGGPAALPDSTPSQPPAGPDLMNTRFAALNTGTMSDTGLPGATYGGPSPAGPGASTAEPPAPSPSTPSVPPSAVAAAAQPPGPGGTPAPVVAGGGPPPVPRAALAGPVLAQAGVTPPVPGRAPTRIPTVTPPPPVRAAPGALTQPPEAGPGAPQTYLEPGQTRMNDPAPLGDRPPKPLIGQDTPEMARIKRTLANPAYRNISPSEREQMTEIYRRLKESRDKQDSENLTEWNRLDADWLTRKKDREEKIRTMPKERLELSEKQNKETVERRFTTAENYKQTVENAKASADRAKTLAESLPNLYKAMDILNNKGIIAGFGANTSPLAINTPVGNIGMPSNMTWNQLWGTLGKTSSREAVENTQEFRALMRPMVKSMLQQTTGAGAISNAEVEQAMEGLGIAGNLEKPAMIKIINNLRENAYRAIQKHNATLDSVFNVPAQDEHLHKQFKVDLPRDPNDVMMLRAVPNSPQERARFDSLYGPGAAARELGYGR